MTDIAITEFAPDFSRSYDLFPLPAGEELEVGEAVYQDASAGTLKLADANAPATAQFFGLVTKNTLANWTADAFRRGHGRIDGLDSLDYGDKLWLSETPGKLTDTNPAKNEIQTLTITGSPTGGTFTITFGTETTGAIAYDATAAAVQAALEALANVGLGNVRCSGGDLPGTAVVIEFVQDLGKYNHVLMTTTDSLTGGSSPASAIAETQAGVHEVLVAEVSALWDQDPPTKMIVVDPQ